MSELDQICPCSSACDPKNYEGRLMLFSDEAWHNWYFSDEKKKCCNGSIAHNVGYPVSKEIIKSLKSSSGNPRESDEE